MHPADPTDRPSRLENLVVLALTLPVLALAAFLVCAWFDLV